MVHTPRSPAYNGGQANWTGAVDVPPFTGPYGGTRAAANAATPTGRSGTPTGQSGGGTAAPGWQLPELATLSRSPRHGDGHSYGGGEGHSHHGDGHHAQGGYVPTSTPPHTPPRSPRGNDNGAASFAPDVERGGSPSRLPWPAEGAKETGGLRWRSALESQGQDLAIVRVHVGRLGYAVLCLSLVCVALIASVAYVGTTGPRPGLTATVSAVTAPPPSPAAVVAPAAHTPPPVPPPAAYALTGITLDFYLQVEPVMWSFAPTGTNLLTGAPLPPSVSQPYLRYKYILYADASFSTKVPQPAYNGILGPILRVQAGDIAKVHLRNAATSNRSFSFHTHGLQYAKDSEGIAPVGPGQAFTYTLTANAHAAPRNLGVSSAVWLYHSHVNEGVDVELGVMGAWVVTAPGMARSVSDRSPSDVDSEFVTLFMDYFPPSGPIMYAINGLVYGHAAGFTVPLGAHVRWHAITNGESSDIHTAHWHGPSMTAQYHESDVVELLGGSMHTLDQTADLVGTWLLHCHVSNHVANGMFGEYRIVTPGDTSAFDPTAAIAGGGTAVSFAPVPSAAI